MTVKLYEDNAGGLAVLHDGQVYRDLEYLEDGTSFADFSAAVVDVIARADPERFASVFPIGDFDELIATWSKELGVEIVGSLGVAGRRFVGVEG